jgi:3-oxoacyl-[acyl-carrier protein] reductase
MRNVIITGGSRGLGLAMAQRLAAAGYRAIAVARASSAELQQSQAALKPGSGAIDFVARDLSQLDGIAGLARALRTDFGPIYGLINNAGLGTSGVLSNMRDRDIEALIRLNTLAPILLTKYVVRTMMALGEGRIINIASVVAATGYGALSVYSASKASLIGFTRSLAREVGSLGITVNALAPGFVETDMTREMDAEQRARVARRSALRRLPEPVDVARSAEFLLGEGGRNITGTVITVDAGNTA